LASDSGGWYRWKSILSEIKDARTTSRWAIEVCTQVTQIYQTEYYTDKQLSVAMYLSMFTLSEEHIVRFQALFEQQPGNSHYRRLWAARAASSHTKCSIHDPTRFAAKASIALKGVISRIFHMTDLANVPNILKEGLTPGGDRFGRRKRADIHFTAFTIFENGQADNRGSILAKRLRRAQAEDTQLAIISMDVDRTWSMLRTCVANGFFLCNQIMLPTLIESIVVATWDSAWRTWTLEFLFEKTLETAVVHGYEGQNWSCAERIAEVLTAGEPQDKRGMRLSKLIEEMTQTKNTQALQQRLSEARQRPISNREALA
jgi:hypothetical protein